MEKDPLTWLEIIFLVSENDANPFGHIYFVVKVIDIFWQICKDKTHVNTNGIGADPIHGDSVSIHGEFYTIGIFFGNYM